MEEKSREIEAAAREYVASRWRWVGPTLAPTALVTVGAALALLSTTIGRLHRPDAKTWQTALVLTSLICLVSGGWGWLKRLASARRDDGGAQALGEPSTVGAAAETTAHRPGGWFYLLMFAAAWGSLFGVMWLALRPTMRSSPSAQLMILTISFICAVESVWMLQKWLRGDWRELARQRMAAAQRDAGVVVEEPTIREPKWWVWPFTLLAGPFVLGTLAVSLRAPMPLQPLVFASGVTLLGLILGVVVRVARDQRAKSPWRLWHFLGWGLYWCYALAVAAGLPQPFTRVSEAWTAAAWVARLIIPLTAMMIVQIVMSEVYSRRQFRRLQRLVNEDLDGTD